MGGRACPWRGRMSSRPAWRCAADDEGESDGDPEVQHNAPFDTSPGHHVSPFCMVTDRIGGGSSMFTQANMKVCIRREGTQHVAWNVWATAGERPRQGLIIHAGYSRHPDPPPFSGSKARRFGGEPFGRKPMM